jgi:DNA-binding CsgD family transcriptional regulator
LSEELLPALAGELVTFLEETSVLETLDVRVLEAGVTQAKARARIAALQRAGALITALPGNRFSVHPVLRELARERLAARGGIPTAHADAALAYAAAGELRAALFHAVAANDPEAAALFLRNHADAASATGDDERLREVVARIDPDGTAGDVRWYVDALLAKARGSVEARAFFVRAAAAAERTGDAMIGFNARAQILENDLAHLRPDTADAVRDVLERGGRLGLQAVSRATMLRGWAYAVGHDFSAALATIAPLVDRGDPVARFNTAILQAYAQTALGTVDAAEATLDGLIRLLENDDRVVLQTLALIWQARLSLTWGNVNLAADAAFGAERLASAMDLHANEAALYTALTEVATHLGDIDATVRFAEHAQRRAEFAWYAADVDRVRAFADTALARAAFLGHENALARDLAARAAGLPDVPPAQRAVLLAEAAVYTLLSAPTAAATAIGQAREAVAAASAIDAADAVALATAGDILAFLAAANGEAPAARHEERAGPFASLIKRRRGLVTLELAGVAVGNARRGQGSTAAFDAARASLTRDGPRFEVRLVSAYASRFINSARSSAYPPPEPIDFTPRERDILALLVDGLTNKEIAQRLSVSSRTVETHVERVLDKLDVRSRSRAIAKAIRLGIVRLDESQI